MRPSSPLAARARVPSPLGAGDLLRALRAVPDPRPGGGRRHPRTYVLAVLVMSFACAGFESLSAAAQWAAGADRALLLALGAIPDPLTGQVHPPSEATIRRMACRVDREAVEAVIAAWTADRLDPAEPEAGRRAVAIDGKTVRGARHDDRPAPHLLAACTHATEAARPVVLAQRQIPGKTNEIRMVAALVDDLRAAGHDPASMVFTADALHTQHRTAALLHNAGAGYVLRRESQPARPAHRHHRAAPRRPAAPQRAAWTRARPHRGTLHRGHPRHRDGLPRRQPGLPHHPLHRRPWTANVRAKRSCTASPTSPQPKPTTPGSPSWSAGTGPSRTASTGSAT